MMVASQPFLNLIKLTFLRAYPSLKPHISFHSSGLAILHSFPDISITHIKVNNEHKFAILNLIIELTFSRAYPSLKLHILFYGSYLHILGKY